MMQDLWLAEARDHNIQIRGEKMKIIVTGAAGFIGSHLVDALLNEGHEVVGIDNLSSGDLSFLEEANGNDRFTLLQEDVLTTDLATRFAGADVVYHLAANPDVRLGASDTYVHVEQNILATHKVLEGMRAAGVPFILFTSTSTVYGEASVIPTPEDYGPLYPISLYGASKLACEALISSYAHTFDMKAILLRFANVVGPRSTHGVTYDFVNKLTEDPEKLVILGDGSQNKSYFHVADCVSGILATYSGSVFADGKGTVAYNIGSEDGIDVNGVARATMDAMGLTDVTFEYTGGVKGGGGWKGDVKVMRLDVEALKKLGWTPTRNSRDSIFATAKHLHESKK